MDINLNDVAGIPNYSLNTSSMITPMTFVFFSSTPCPDAEAGAWWYGNLSFHTPVSFNIQESSPSLTL